MTAHETTLVQQHLAEQQQAIIAAIISNSSEILTIACLSKIIKESYSVDHLKEN